MADFILEMSKHAPKLKSERKEKFRVTIPEDNYTFPPFSFEFTQRCEYYKTKQEQGHTLDMQRQGSVHRHYQEVQLLNERLI